MELTNHLLHFHSWFSFSPSSLLPLQFQLNVKNVLPYIQHTVLFHTLHIQQLTHHTAHTQLHTQHTRHMSMVAIMEHQLSDMSNIGHLFSFASYKFRLWSFLSGHVTNPINIFQTLTYLMFIVIFTWLFVNSCVALMSMFFFYFKQCKTAEVPRKTAPVKEAAEQTNCVECCCRAKTWQRAKTPRFKPRISKDILC